MMMMLNLVSSLAFQITFGAEPLVSISRPFHLCLPFLNVTSQVILRTQVQVSLTTQNSTTRQPWAGLSNCEGCRIDLNQIYMGASKRTIVLFWPK